MNRNFKKIITILILVCFVAVTIFSIAMPLFTYASPQSEIDAVTKKKNEEKQKINEAEKKHQNALNEKSHIEQQIAPVQAEIDAYQQEIDDAEARIAQKEIELAEAEKKAQAQYDTMKLRLRSMYEDNSASYVTLLLSGESFTDMFSYIELIKQLVDYDNNMYDSLNETTAQIETAKETIESEKKGLEEKQSKLIAKRDELAALEAKLDKTISSIATDLETYKKAYAEFERQEAALKATISSTVKSSGSGGANYSGGTLAWPTPGYGTITSPYGYRIHPTLKVYKLHTGIDIAAPMNAKVVAAEDGLVVTSQYSSAYGNYIVINHGNGVSTLYAHHSKNLVSVGQQVERGQQIAKVGSTGFSTGPHSHFEVLLNGSCTDPMPYLQ